MEVVICEYCNFFNPVLAEDYYGHVIAFHKIKLPWKNTLPKYLKLEIENINELFPNEFNYWLKNKLKIDIKEKKRLFLKECLLVSITWKHLLFDNEKIIFNKEVGNNLQPLFFQASIVALNEIKDEYFNTVYYNARFRLCFYNGIINFEFSPDIYALLSCVTKAKYYSDSLNQINLSISSRKLIYGHSLDETKKIITNKLNHSKYFKFLAEIQIPNFKIIPLREIYQNHAEDAILFLVKTNKGRIMVIWENINPDRAAHTFLCESFELDDMLRKIMSFILKDEMKIKRDILNRDDIECKRVQWELKHLRQVKHNDIYNFKSYLRYLIRRN